MKLSPNEVRQLIIDQYEILQKIAQDHGENVTHIKPHGALNNMACEDIDLATTLAKAINEINWRTFWQKKNQLRQKSRLQKRHNQNHKKQAGGAGLDDVAFQQTN